MNSVGKDVSIVGAVCVKLGRWHLHGRKCRSGRAQIKAVMPRPSPRVLEVVASTRKQAGKRVEAAEGRQIPRIAQAEVPLANGVR